MNKQELINKITNNFSTIKSLHVKKIILLTSILPKLNKKNLQYVLKDNRTEMNHLEDDNKSIENCNSEIDDSYKKRVG